jgi:PhnB protein
MPEMGPADNIMHCSIKVGESTIMMSDDLAPGGGSAPGNISLAIGLNDPARARQLFANLAESGTVLMSLDKTYWAEAFGIVIDRFGVKWMINCDAPN